MKRRKRNRLVPEMATGPLQGRQVLIKSHRPELEARAGVIYECPCGSNHFFIWRLTHQRLPHMQCVRCGAVFCTGNDCKHDEEEDRALRAEMEGKPSPDNKG